MFQFLLPLIESMGASGAAGAAGAAGAGGAAGASGGLAGLLGGKATLQGAGMMDNFINGSKSPGLGNFLANMQDGNYASAAGNVLSPQDNRGANMAMSAVNEPPAQSAPTAQPAQMPGMPGPTLLNSPYLNGFRL